MLYPRVVLQGFVVDLMCHLVMLRLVVGMLYPYVEANKQSVDYKIMVDDNKRPSKDNNTIRHQEDTATNGMPNDDKATSTKDKTIIIH
jgi:hypothetical protein